MAVDSDNQLWVWGRNEFGQVGQGHCDSRSRSLIKPLAIYCQVESLMLP